MRVIIGLVWFVLGCVSAGTSAEAAGPTYPQVNLDFLAVHEMPVSLQLLRNTYEYEKKARGARKLFGSLPVGIGFATAGVAASAAMFGDKAKAAELFHAAWEGIWMAVLRLLPDELWRPAADRYARLHGPANQ